MLKGWVELQFEDGRALKVEEGDSLFIPGYLCHIDHLRGCTNATGVYGYHGVNRHRQSY
jgi:hypothetical protein